MSDRTQAEGRSFYTEHDFPFTPAPNTDLYRTSLRWLIELQRQLTVGSGAFDVTAKTAAMTRVPDALKTFTVTAVTPTVKFEAGEQVDVEVATASIVGYSITPAAPFPAGLTLVSIGKSIRIQGKSTVVGAFSVSTKFSHQNYTDVTVAIAGEVEAAAPPAP